MSLSPTIDRPHVAGPPGGPVWTPVCEVRRILPDSGVAALVDGVQVARWTSGHTFIWEPAQALSRGRHTVVLEVTLAGYKPVRLDWSFERVNPPSQPAARDVTAEALAAVNRFRAAAGLPPVSAAAGLAQAARHHAAYLAAHSQAQGLDAHTEQPGRAGFTGTGVGDRAYAFGWIGFRPNEGVVLSSRALEAAAAVQTLVDTVYHRLPFQVPGATALGAGLQGGRFVVMTGQPAGSSGGTGPSAPVGGSAAPAPLDIHVYPADGQVRIPLAWDGAETPDPYRLFPGARPGGYPITAVLGCSRVYHCYDAVTVTAARLYRERGGVGGSALAPVPVRVLTPDNDPFLRSPPAAALLPVDPLRPGTRYTVELSLRVRTHGGGDQAVTKRWSFTTTRGEADRAIRAPHVRIEVDGRALRTPAPPVIVAGRVLVPFRALAEALGAAVTWDAATRSVTMGDAVVVRVDNDIAWIEDTQVRLDVAPRIEGDRVYVPLRFVAEALGVTVHWHADQRLVAVVTEP